MTDIRTTPMRDALAWATNDPAKAKEPSSNPFVWLWEAIEGDFNEDRSTAQILIDAGISMIPLVDQICDIRDLIANVKKLSKDVADKWAWVALGLTLVGLIPTLGSLVKGVLKIIFGFIRRAGERAVLKAIDAAMTWVITFLRRREVQRYINQHKIDEIFKWLALELRAVRPKVNVGELLAGFDRCIKVVQGLVAKVEHVPVLAGKAKAVLQQVKDVRMVADKHLADVVKPLQDYLDAIIVRLEREALARQRGIVDVANVHFRGTLPEEAAVALMRKNEPSWLSKEGEKFFESVDVNEMREIVRKASAKTNVAGRRTQHKDRFPSLSDESIESFHTIAMHKITGPARLYRIIGPSSRAMSDCWVTEAVFKKLQSAPDPKAAWRRRLGVWPEWNPDGQYVVYEVKAGETLNTWRGIAASQRKSSMPDHFLQGGDEQIVFNLERKDVRNDSVLYYEVQPGKELALTQPMTQAEVDAAKAKMTREQSKAFDRTHLGLRQKINHPNISGPYETGWGYTDFDGATSASRIGLPDLPGQLTNVNK
jgi:hypothetical protein